MVIQLWSLFQPPPRPQHLLLLCPIYCYFTVPVPVGWWPQQLLIPYYILSSVQTCRQRLTSLWEACNLNRWNKLGGEVICQEEKLIFGFAPDGARSRCLVINPPFPRGARVLPAGSPQLENLPATAFLLQFCWRQIAPCLTHGVVRSLITENVLCCRSSKASSLPAGHWLQNGWIVLPKAN